MSKILDELREDDLIPESNERSRLRDMMKKWSASASSTIQKFDPSSYFDDSKKKNLDQSDLIKKLLEKTLAASLDAIKKIEDSEKKREMTERVDKSIDQFQTDSSIDMYELKALTDSIQKLTGVADSAFDAVDKLVDLDYKSLIREQVSSNLTSLGGSDSDKSLLQSGQMSIDDYAKKYNLTSAVDVSMNSDSIITDLLSRTAPTNPESKADYSELVNELRKGNLNSQTFTESARVLPGVDARMMNKLAILLDKIAENTDPDNQLSHADKLRQESRSQMEVDALKDISDKLDDSKSSDDSESRIAQALATQDNQQLGENLADMAFDSAGDMLGTGDESTRTDRENRRRRRRVRNGRAPRATGGLAARTAKAGSSITGTLSKGARSLGGKAGLLGGALALGYGAYDYANAEDSASRIDAVTDNGGMAAGAAAGGMLGATVGSIVPIVGTTIGGIAGGLIGGVAGSGIGQWIGDQFKDLSDYIPDSVKQRGPVAELNYIDNVLYPSAYTEISAGNSKFDKDDLVKLMKYRDDLLKIDIPKYMKEHAEEVSPEDLGYLDAVQKSELTTTSTGAGSIPQGTVTIQPNYGGGGIPEYTGLGSVSAKYESGGRGVGTISSGKGDAGGVSYGTYQLASKTGTMAKFLQSPEGKKYGAMFGSASPGTPEFNRIYSEIVKQDSEGFNKAQHDYIKRTHYDPVAQYATKAGMDLSNPATQEALWSQSVQHSYKGNAAIIDDWAKNGGAGKDFKGSMTQLYQSRSNYAGQFASAAATSKRYERELGDVIALNESVPRDVQQAIADGMENPVEIAMKTNRNPDEVRKYMNQSNDVGPTEYVTKKKVDETPAPPQVIALPGSGKSDTSEKDPHRLSDMSIQFASVLRG